MATPAAVFSAAALLVVFWDTLQQHPRMRPGWQAVRPAADSGLLFLLDSVHQKLYGAVVTVNT